MNPKRGVPGYRHDGTEVVEKAGGEKKPAAGGGRARGRLVASAWGDRARDRARSRDRGSSRDRPRDRPGCSTQPA